MTKYRSKYYSLIVSIIEQSITIEDALKIRMLNNLGLEFKTYFFMVNVRIWKDKKLDKDDVLLKAIEGAKICIKAKYKAWANFVSTKLNVKPQGRIAEGKKKFVE